MTIQVTLTTKTAVIVKTGATFREAAVEAMKEAGYEVSTVAEINDIIWAEGSELVLAVQYVGPL